LDQSFVNSELAAAGRSQRGQGMVEYAFILLLVGLVVLTMLVATGHQVVNLFSTILSTLRQAGL
jgi:Flp pilus assembly pilin Flp